MMETEAMNEQGTTVSDIDVLNAIPRGHVNDVRILNLLAAKTAEDLSGLQSINDVNLILVPDHLVGALGTVDMNDVNAVVGIPTDGKYALFCGETKLTGEAIAAGDPDTRLIVVGQTVVTTPVESVGFREIYMVGQIFAPRGSESALTAQSKNLVGQCFYYPQGARFFMGHDSLGAAFFQYLEQPAAIVVMGHLEFEDDVTPQILREKVPEILLFGHIEASRELVPMVQVLATEKHGEISAR
jgi:hypothetical protein